MEHIDVLTIFAPSIALLILSTTIRLGNVRLVILDIARVGAKVKKNNSKQYFIRRAGLLSQGLTYLNIAFFILVLYSASSFAAQNLAINFTYLTLFIGIVFSFSSNHLSLPRIPSCLHFNRYA